MSYQDGRSENGTDWKETLDIRVKDLFLEQVVLVEE